MAQNKKSNYFKKMLGFWALCSILIHPLTGWAFDRPDQGQPITAQEREQATFEFTTLMKDLRYFDFIDSRTHGIPKTNSSGAYWYGHMWTGVKVSKQNGVVKFTHGKTGSDNVGIHTAPYLEGACYAYRLTKEKNIKT